MVLGFPILALGLNYDAGWNWDTLAYADFWTVTGFLRHSFINGWHPVIPWLAFLIVGMAIARLDLANGRTRTMLFGAGALLLAVAHLQAGAVQYVTAGLITQDSELLEILPLLTSPSPIPPAPTYMLSATGSAMMVLMICLWAGDRLCQTVFIAPFVATGRQALTLYIAHIIVGMGLLEAMGWIATPSYDPKVSLAASTGAAMLFVGAAMLYASLWQAYLGSGPLERLLRKLS